MNEEQAIILKYLKNQFPFFENDLMLDICRRGSINNVPANSKLMEPGKYIKFLPLLCDGLIEIYRDDTDSREALLYFLKPGEVCTSFLACCVTDYKSEIHARALENSILITIPINDTDEWLTKYSTWKNFIFSQYRMRFNELLETIDSLAFLSMDKRLIRFFITLHKTTNKTTFDGSHSDIAQSLSTSREVISRLLKTLENQNKVTLSRNKIDFSNLL
jgi:CRP/FNR family transcriptional regulator, anaerobic regulatory protein